MADVARLCGVSGATVSRVINKDTRVAPETRERILAVIEKTGYVPDRLSQGLVRMRWQRRSGKDHPSFALVQTESNTHFEAAAKQAAAELDYRLDILGPTSHPGSKRLAAILRARSIMGVIVNLLAEKPVPVVLPPEEFIVVNSNLGLEGYHTVSVNLFGSTVNAWERCRLAGCQRIGLAYVPPPHSTMERDIAAAGRYLLHELAPQTRGVSLHMHPCDFQMERVQDLAAFIRRERLDAIIVRHDGFYWRLHDLGFRMPQDLKCISLARSSSVEDSIIAGFSPTPQVVARESVRLLHRMTQLRERGLSTSPITYSIDQEWRPGASLPETERPKHE